MKELTTLILLFVASLIGSTQTTVEEFTNKYKNEKDATVVTLKGNIFSLLGDIAEWSDDEEAEMAARIFKGINSMEVLSLSLYDADISKEEITDFKSNLIKEKYEEYINVRDGRETVEVYAQGSKENISNMLIIVQERDDFSLINIDGSLSHKDIAYIVEHHDDWD
ncbi:MAG: DUF4252 domain-containing protein [Cyclobacteriaceae bacterium]|nr:DUF4252 domain-containing protein [Cyclobacteriaceae bacterium]